MARVEKVKINLGCGNKILPGYLNVDLYNRQAEMRADIRKITFPENYADEVLGVHVIEHINRAEGSVLIERAAGWLKPGGKLVLETPCAVKCWNLINQQRGPTSKLTLHGAKGFWGGRSGSSLVKKQWHRFLMNWARSVFDSKDFSSYQTESVDPIFVQPGERHEYVWDMHELCQEMVAAGLDARREEPRFHGGRSYRDCRVVGVKL